MREYLYKLGFSPKEAEVYLALLELGSQPSSIIGRKTGFPKATALFLLEGLVGRGFVTRSQRGRTLYFHASPDQLEQVLRRQLDTVHGTLGTLLPLLREFQSPYSSPPKVTFYEGIEGCRRVYNQLLESSTEILEFGVHDDLVQRLGQDFMNAFIAGRIARKLFLRALAHPDVVEVSLQRLDKVQCREIRLLPEGVGRLYSSIAIYEDKVLILNLHHDAFAILMENTEVSESLRTIFGVVWQGIKG